MMRYIAILTPTPGINAQVAKMTPREVREVHSALRFRAESFGEACGFYVMYCRHMLGLTVTLKDFTLADDANW